MAERLTQRFHETDRYATYLRTTEGRLRFDLGWANLRPFEAYRRLVDLELLLGAQPQFAAVARYTQVIARASCEASFRRPE